MHTRPEIIVRHDPEAAFWGVVDDEWQATEGDYDLDCTVGYGRTPLDAIVDLLDKLES